MTKEKARKQSDIIKELRAHIEKQNSTVKAITNDLFISGNRETAAAYVGGFDAGPGYATGNAPTLPNSFTAHGPGSDHWIALSESGKPKSIKGCGCRLNGECAIKGDWDKGESSSCDECRYQTTKED